MEIYNVKVEKNGKSAILAIFMTSWRKMEAGTDTFLFTNVYYYVWRTFCSKQGGPTFINNREIPDQKLKKIHFFLEKIDVFDDLWRHDTWHTHKTIYILKGINNIYHLNYIAALKSHKHFRY